MKELNNSSDLCNYINQTIDVAPVPVQELLKAQLQIVQVYNTPTLVDSALSRIIENLNVALHHISNEEQKEEIRRHFAHMIESMIFYLDANIQKIKEENAEKMRDIVKMSNERLMESMRDTMLMAINTFGTGVKATATTIDHAGKDFLISVNSIATEDILTVGSSKIKGEMDNQGHIIVTKEPISETTEQTIQEINNKTIDTLDKHRGEYSKQIAGHVDNWTKSMSEIVIHNIFSKERIEQSNDLLSKVLDFLNDKRKEEKALEDFTTIIHNTIEKLGKYQTIIGKSIIISDMIERYIKLLKSPKTELQCSKLFKLDKKAIIHRIPVVGPILFITDLKNDISKILKQRYGRTSAEIFGEYQKIADSYSIV